MYSKNNLKRINGLKIKNTNYICTNGTYFYLLTIITNTTMGKGDIKTRRGKIFNGSFGNTRPQKNKKATAVVVVKPEPVKTRTAKKK